MKSTHHLSGKLHLTGRSHFIADEAPVAGMLHAKLLFSPIAHARIINLDISKALAYPGVHRVLGAKDIPGPNQIGHVIKDEPLFPAEIIMYAWQPLAMVLAEDEQAAEAAVKLITLEYEELPPILDEETADAAKEWYVPERSIESGDVDSIFASAPHIMEGKTKNAGQEHFYMEGQRCRAIPFEDSRLLLHCATQSTMEVQEVVSHLLGIPAHDIVVDVPRLGGAFGGKERAATIWACMAALGAFVCRKPVQVKLNRDEDMRATGKRHPFTSLWKVAYDNDGRILAYDIQLLANGGAYADLSVAILERAMFHAENTYHIPNARIRGRACRTNLPPNTAFRGFGAPQGIFVIESVIQQIAKELALDPIAIRMLNAYHNGDKTPYDQEIKECQISAIYDKLAEKAAYDKLKADVAQFNASHKNHKRGLGIMPVKFGISFTTALLNQGSALVWVYIDGSVSVSTGGVEMGQELSTKVAVVVSRVLGIRVEQIRVESSNTQRVGNASPTAASTGSDINGNAARIAAEKVREQLREPAAKLLEQNSGTAVSPEDLVFSEGKVYLLSNPQSSVSFQDLIGFAYVERVPLGAYGYYRTPDLWFNREIGKGRPFHYYVYGAALAEVELDCRMGEHTLKQLFIIHENGQSLHTEIDMGQVIGAAVQGYGWCTMEDLVWDDKGRYTSANPSTYKIPGIRDLPENFQVELLPSQSKEASVFGSKATGEPPLIYGLAVFFALQEAVREVKPDAVLSFPATPEALLLSLK
ncbi:MAG: xanthine dehydrogenase [Candidatus Cloacimonetes bacterium HGW-Cloacimonetes-3]|jgi:xanthine dehydrogenase large subunit|nr:MAG: xanthine dehydrogenase [Candidatus Cloacimonetes bacterium HGW-Cloacimonetes-3]